MIESYNLVRLESNYKLKPFDCDDSDLNEFYEKDSLNYLKQLFAVTYIFEEKNKAIAFYSVSNDKIAISDSKNISKNRWKMKIQKNLPHPKRRYSFPAVKIGRLGVCKQKQGLGLGTEILDFIKASFTYKNKTGCRFIVVDAYNKENVIEFYQKNGFDILPSKIEENDITVLMYYDLLRFRIE